MWVYVGGDGWEIFGWVGEGMRRDGNFRDDGMMVDGLKVVRWKGGVVGLGRMGIVGKRGGCECNVGFLVVKFVLMDLFLKCIGWFEVGGGLCNWGLLREVCVKGKIWGRMLEWKCGGLFGDGGEEDVCGCRGGLIFMVRNNGRDLFLRRGLGGFDRRVLGCEDGGWGMMG